MYRKIAEKTIEFDERMKEIPYFELYPQMIPFIGKHYASSEEKLLLLAQNPIIDEKFLLKSPEMKNILDNWYILDMDKIKENKNIFWYIEKWTNLEKNLIKYAKGNFIGVPRSQYLFSSIIKASKEIDFFNQNQESIFSYIAFMDFFQKPHLPEEFKPNEQDKEMSLKILKKVIEIIQPTLIFFISDLGYRIWESSDMPVLFDKINVGYGSLPASPWWNRKDKEKLNGEERFKNFIKEMKI
jgi:hypothetical protein